MKKSSIILVCIMAMSLFVAGIAVATNGFMNSFNGEYGTAQTSLNSCSVCHTSIPNLNSYGQAWVNNGRNFLAIEDLDSDGDGWINIDEIDAGFFPGDGNSTPPGSPPAEPFCGDGVVDQALGEACDDGNNVDGDGCSASCIVEADPSCGDGVVNGNEVCDDGNNVAGDGCRGNCTEELCGDGIVDPQEDCDDGNTLAGDGCAADCTIEPVTTTPTDPTVPTVPSLPAAHTDEEDGVLHMPGKDEPFSNGCIACHGTELTGPASGGFAPSCFSCHGQEWDEERPVVIVPNDDDDDDERDRRRPRRRDRRSSDSDD